MPKQGDTKTNELLRLVERALKALGRKPYTPSSTVVWAAVRCDSETAWPLDECEQKLRDSHLTGRPIRDLETRGDGVWWTRSVGGEHVEVAVALTDAALVFAEAVIQELQLENYLQQLAIRITTAGKSVFQEPGRECRLVIGLDGKMLATCKISETFNDRTHWDAARGNLREQLSLPRN